MGLLADLQRRNDSSSSSVLIKQEPLALPRSTLLSNRTTPMISTRRKSFQLTKRRFFSSFFAWIQLFSIQFTYLPLNELVFTSSIHLLTLKPKLLSIFYPKTEMFYQKVTKRPVFLLFWFYSIIFDSIHLFAFKWISNYLKTPNFGKFWAENPKFWPENPKFELNKTETFV